MIMSGFGLSMHLSRKINSEMRNIIKTFFLAGVLSFFTIGLFSQVAKPVKWQNQLIELGDDLYEVVFKANIKSGWHLYGLNIPDGGPIATSFNFDQLENFELVGKITSSVKPEVKYDKTFEMNLELFDNEVTFKQKIKKTDKIASIKGFVEFMACDDAQCLPPSEVDFEYEVGETIKAEKKELPKRDETPVFGAEKVTIETSSENTVAVETKEEQVEIEQITDIKPAEKESSTEKKSLWLLFWEAFSKGLIAIFTPCVFPIIPLTVAFFMRDNTTARRVFQAIFFGLSIVGIYSLVGLIAGLFQLDITELTKNWVANIIIAAVLITFAASFFGVFELVLPSKLSTKLDGEVDKGGILAPFFLALVTAVVSFSCVGPIAGVAIGAAMTGEIAAPVVAMAGFSSAFALPFVLLGIFPGFMKSMPKSGGWLNAVKVFFAFIMLAAAYIFLGNTQWAIFNRDVILALNISTFILLGFYLLGKIKFSHDSELNHISFPRVVLAIISFTIAIYMVPGLFGSPLKSLAPFLPAQDTSGFTISAAAPGQASLVSNQVLCDASPKYSDLKGVKLPHGLKGYFDYEEGLACAKEQNKPVLLDFVGHSCKNCKKMYADVWSDPDILNILKEEYIVIALYTDERAKLPEDEWIKSDIDGKIKKTVGKKNIDFEISKFGTNALPLYVILDTDGNTITNPGTYTYNPSIADFKAYLTQGVKNFKK